MPPQKRAHISRLTVSASCSKTQLRVHMVCKFKSNAEQTAIEVVHESILTIIR